MVILEEISWLLMFLIAMIILTKKLKYSFYIGYQLNSSKIMFYFLIILSIILIYIKIR